MKQTILKRLEEEFSSRITNTKPYIYAWSENISVDAVLSFLESELTLFENQHCACLFEPSKIEGETNLIESCKYHSGIEKEVREKTLVEVMAGKLTCPRHHTSLRCIDCLEELELCGCEADEWGIRHKSETHLSQEDLHTPQEECDNVPLHECPKGIWDGKRHSKRPLGTSQEEEEK